MTEEILNSNWKLRKGLITAARQMTETEKLFEIKLEGRELDHEPGQFVQVEIYGVGEAPISVCSSPTRRGSPRVPRAPVAVCTPSLLVTLTRTVAA